ncbi:hypothetical protein ACFRKE_27910 [Kitasatospora indigofera]|uniref:hypothetical protein n=1 Tax=Kitasatospora indigofera TaxID=67307 RepID=UPI0036D09D2E
MRAPTVSVVEVPPGTRRSTVAMLESRHATYWWTAGLGVFLSNARPIEGMFTIRQGDREVHPDVTAALAPERSRHSDRPALREADAGG